MKHYDVAKRLIESTINVIAEQGMDKATTKAIAASAGLNEAYIYRNFDDKEVLFQKTFAILDEYLLGINMDQMPALMRTDLSAEEKHWIYFSNVWRSKIDHPNMVKAYIRYLYSPYFLKNSLEDHRKRFAPLIERFSLVFKDGADVWLILHHMLNGAGDFAVRVFHGEAADNSNTSQHVFQVIYNSIHQYFRT